MTTADLYKQHKSGKISKEKFLYEVRRDQNLPFITNLTSYSDAIKILKNKSIIKESIDSQEETAMILDKMNPYIVKRAVEFELDKMPEISDENYEKARAKVAKTLLKNIHAYDDLLIANSKTVEKKDADLKMLDVKKENTVDKKNEMKKPKGTQVLKANVKSSKKENKKGNPKGVKQMTYDAKKAKGIKKVMEKTGKEKVLEAITKVLKEDSHFSYGIGQTVPTPEGEGVVKEIVGGTLTVELKNGNTKDYQINVIEYAKEQSKLPKVEETPVENKQKEKKDSSIISKLKEIVKKIKLKKEAFALKDKAGNVQYAKDSTEASDIQNKAKAKGVMLTKTSV